MKRDTPKQLSHVWNPGKPVGLQLPTLAVATPIISIPIYTWAVAEVVEGIMTQIVESIEGRGHDPLVFTTNAGL